MNLKADLQEAEDKLKTLWSNNKLLLCTLLLPILILKFHSLIISLLVGDSKQILSDTVKQDTALANQETAANTQADQIIANADTTAQAAQNKPVDENWNKE